VTLSQLLAAHARKCPRCGYDLTGSIDAGVSRCPECALEITLQELWMMHCSDPQGRPNSLSPNELRVEGKQLLRWIMTGLCLLVLVIALLISLLG
jgi:hypothetical protein